ncbi:PREDICTED: peptidylglycine alpha-hydroxylating monooxygenase isoform X2 [Ceratosolen solmsi marchali]|uniref:peptidylglycine monooxygenase n=1 Tax=Ceratosolen solmsi marchali TaxID=326594 RepID=A0AAJ7E028_9HYME|nr:PREDICTED: peptidylglycine alpha-hydroxylating monooxygenase isoform X2 [Ceratosolen solmsi marchali]
MPELYLCSPVKIDNENTYYIVGFEPNATMNTAHHIILYSCSTPGSAEPIWNCGEMSFTESLFMTIASPCQDSSEIIYAWARDAPELILPDNVGFKVGKGSLIKYLVLQIHYAHIDKFKDGTTDDSGITLHLTRQPLNKLAGVYILGTGGGIPPHSVEYMESSCEISENKTIHPFAYRVHTHSLGKIVSGYVIRNNKWIELGKRDPLKPQMFYNIHYNGTIKYGDRLAARCTMQSELDTWTYVGNTNNDEMCNFYLMYYVENEEPLSNKFCFSSGPPKYYWHIDGLINIPDREASTL